ncbi:MAG: Mpo1-like protein [Candidatus Baltobacteraceae bacterium]
MTREQLYGEYGSYHKDSRNRLCHAIGIPLIVLGILGLLALVRLGPVDLAVLAAIAVLIYYAAIDPRGALLSALIFLMLYLIGIRLSWEANVAAFILGWGFQLIGHRYEGNKPKFLTNMVYLLVGPLYMFGEIFMTLIHRRRPT